MTHVYRFSTLILATLLLLGLTTTAALAAPPNQDPNNGQIAWEEQVFQCQRCHGPMGEGSYARPLSNSTLTAQEWISQVRSPRRFMPHFSEAQVSDQQIIDMHAYITALPDPAGDFAPKAAAIPADAPEGQRLMAEKRCVACHTDVVETGQGMIINGFIERGITPTADVVIKQLRTPFRFMPAFSEDQVSDAEAALIADYLAAQVANQAPPANLPQSGSAAPTLWVAGLLLAGSVLLGAGLFLRRLIAIS